MTDASTRQGSDQLVRMAAWTPLAFIALFSIGWFGLARFFPPISPALSANEVAAIVNAHHTSLMAAAVAIMVATVLLMPCSAVLVLMIRKIEGRSGVITIMMGFTLTTNLVSNFFTGFFLSAAAFRIDRSPEITQLAIDLTFLLIMGGIPLFVMIFFLTAYALLVVSPRDKPVLPRWAGYVNLWAGILFLPELLIYFFKTGPFAWDGVVGFWIPAVIFVSFFVVVTFVVVPLTRRRRL